MYENHTNAETPQDFQRELDRSSPLHRRAFFTSLFGGITAVALIRRFGFADQNEALLEPAALSPAVQASSSPVAPPASIEATPVASPVAKESIGEIAVIRGESFDYPGIPVESETLTLAVTGGSANLNFSPAAFRQSYQLSASYLDPLVWINDVTMEPEPWLAQSWVWSDDNKSITFTLRDDVRWHDGDLLSARDVVFSFEVYRDDVDSGARNLFTQMDQAEAVDNRTVRVDLVTPDGNWLRNASSQLIFQRKQYIDHWTGRPVGQRSLSDFNWTTDSPIGTGPWVVGNRRSVRVEFSRNDAYWSVVPNFQELYVLLEESEVDLLERWRSNEIDLLWPVAPGELESVADTPANLYVANGAQVMFAAFNFDNQARALPSLLADIRIRQALTRAIDRDRFANGTFQGFTRAYATGTVAQPWAFDSSQTSPKQDLALAKQLLAEVGLSDLNNDGSLEDFNGAPLVFSVIVRDDADPKLIQVLEGMSQDFLALGTQLSVRILPPADFFTTWTETRDYDFIAYSYPLYPGFTDYDLYGSNYDIRINPQGWNPGGYDNPEADAAIKRILIATDPDRQKGLLTDLQTVVNDDLFGLWFGFPDDLVLARQEIVGFQPNKYLPTLNTRLLWRDQAEG